MIVAAQDAEDQARRPRQFRLRTLMIWIAFVALFITVLIQQVLLQRATARAQLLQAEAEQHRILAERARDVAVAEATKARVEFELFRSWLSQQAKASEKAPAAAQDVP